MNIPEVMFVLPLFIFFTLTVSIISTEITGNHIVALFLWIMPVLFAMFLSFVDD